MLGGFGRFETKRTSSQEGLNGLVDSYVDRVGDRDELDVICVNSLVPRV